ncbi:hypothetical protein [Paenibacillus sp. ACRRY]|uniref:hypothetical protein n=1 Tax=Paenibacillus sp. ACRRY TaxID=2918208 RepID=UPI001EF4FCF9|nr:hypothetical protein [Paenibacillus sp. ACRRY]MCG7384377.1 hypothetical protein [Paenibacillus sp. ACRRY]
MNKDFLYTKPYVPGIIDDTPVDLESWFLDDSRERMEEKVRSSSLNDLIIELINIFKEGEPNYQVLLGLFGEKIVKEVREEENVYSVSQILRSDEDIKKIEIETEDESLAIKKMSIYVDLASFAAVEKDMTNTNVHILTSKTSDSLSVHINGRTISLIVT